MDDRFASIRVVDAVNETERAAMTTTAKRQAAEEQAKRIARMVRAVAVMKAAVEHLPEKRS